MLLDVFPIRPSLMVYLVRPSPAMFTGRLSKQMEGTEPDGYIQGNAWNISQVKWIPPDLHVKNDINNLKRL